MKTSKNGIALISYFESFQSKPYLCPAKVATIGYGSTKYSNGVAVKMTDPAITKTRAAELLLETLMSYEREVSVFLGSTKVTQSQFDACVAFHYNTGAFSRSTLGRKIKANPKDASIWGEFLRWSKVRADNDGRDNDGDGIVDEVGEMKDLLGLVRRRNSEAHLYTLGTLNYYENIK